MGLEKFVVVSMRQVGACVGCGESMSTCASCRSCGTDVCLDCAEVHDCDGDESEMGVEVEA